MSNQDIFNEQVKRRIALERYSNAQTRETITFLKELEKDIASQMVRVSMGKKTEYTRMLQEVRKLIDAAYERFTTATEAQMKKLAAEEARFQAQKLKSAGLKPSAFNSITPEIAFAAANARPMDGALLKDWFKGMAPAARKRMDRALRISFAEGESIGRAITRMKREININRKSAAAVIRTANTHISNSAQQASAEANSDIVGEVEWRSILDSRTTPICASRDGQRYPIDSGPRPPAHIGCRSIVIEVLKDFPPPQRQTYGDWLKDQPADVQNDVLGPTRGKLFREGKYTVKQFVDRRGKTLTLEELGEAKAKPKPRAVPRTTTEKRFETNADARRSVIQKGAKAGNRHIVAVDSKGNVIGRQAGTKNTIKLTPEIEQRLDGKKREVVIHYNTAGNRGVSAAVGEMVDRPGLRSVWGHAKNGSSFKVTPKRGNEFVQGNLTTIEAYVDGYLKTQVSLERISLQDAQMIASHITMQVAKRDGLIGYTYKLAKGHSAALNRNKRIVNYLMRKA